MAMYFDCTARYARMHTRCVLRHATLRSHVLCRMSRRNVSVSDGKSDLVLFFTKERSDWIANGMLRAGRAMDRLTINATLFHTRGNNTPVCSESGYPYFSFTHSLRRLIQASIPRVY